ncbi:hypothetical protein BRC2024_OFSGVTRC_CDS_0074 [Acinetobacter phage vB_AbaM_Rocket]
MQSIAIQEFQQRRRLLRRINLGARIDLRHEMRCKRV